MKYIRSFDAAAAKLTTRLPDHLKQPFTILGLLTSPLAWTFYVLISLLVQLPTAYETGLVILVALPVATLIKFSFRRQRPPTIYAGNMRIKSYSFPSSHSYASALATTYFASLAVHGGLIWLAVLLPLVAVTVAISRVYLGAHYPSDVVAGVILGWLVAAGVLTWL